MQRPPHCHQDRIGFVKQGRFSRTAYKVALRRAAHQLFDQPKVLDDPLAVPIVGAEAAEKLRASPKERDHPVARAFRAFMAARSRYAEDQLAQAVEQRVAQYVVLGAGLDTFAYRNPHAAYLRVFEVDHPATQAWKLERDPYLLETSIPGIFACGDVRSGPVKRVAAAVGEGSMAIAFVHQYLQATRIEPATTTGPEALAKTTD